MARRDAEALRQSEAALAAAGAARRAKFERNRSDLAAAITTGTGAGGPAEIA